MKAWTSWSHRPRIDFALRSYRDEGEHYANQLGSEDTPQVFLDALWAATAEMARVLKPSGSIFVDLGDKYAGSGGHNNAGIAKEHSIKIARAEDSGLVEVQERMTATRRNAPDRYNQDSGGTPAKSLMLLPERYRIGCVDRLGLIARAIIVWSKPNGLPESVTDRVRRSHEEWVHLTKAPRYFAAMDEVREAHAPWTLKAYEYEKAGYRRRDNADRVDRGGFAKPPEANPLGKLPGSVWSVPSEPLRVPDHLPQHFAAFPQEWPRRLILGWSPSGICVECGEGRRPVVDRGYRSKATGYDSTGRWGLKGQPEDTPLPTRLGDGVEATIVGYACACTPYTDHAGSGENPRRRVSSTPRSAGGHQLPLSPDDPEYGVRVGPRREYHLDGWTPPPTRPAVVLDPFVGTGTTVLVARALGRFGVGVDLSADYLRLARWRVFESGQGAKAIRRTNLERQGGLFTQPDAYRPTDVVETGELL